MFEKLQIKYVTATGATKSKMSFGFIDSGFNFDFSVSIGSAVEILKTALLFNKIKMLQIQKF